MSGTGLSLTNSMTFDLAGRMLTQTATNGLTTTYTYNGLIETVTLPGGATNVTERYRDGRVKSVTGTAVVAEYRDYSQVLAAGEYYSYSPHTITIITNGASTGPRWRRDVTDLREMKVEQHLPGLYGVITNQYLHDDRGLPAGFAQPLTNSLWAGWTGTPNPPATDTIANRLEYEKAGAIMGNTNFVYQDIFLNGLHLNYPDLALSRKLIENRSWFETDNTNWYRVSTNLIYLTDNSTNATIQSISKERITGLDSVTKTLVTQIDADTNITTMTITVDRPNKKVTQVIDTAQSVLNATNITINGLAVQQSSASVSTPTSYFYDSLARSVRVQDPLAFNTGTQYDPNTGQVTATTNATGQVTFLEYYPGSHLNAGRLKSQTEANGKKTYFDYTARGEPQHVWGDVPYPVERKYSAFGELTNMVTFRTGSGWNSSSWPTGNTGDNTYWNYDGASGWLLSKKDASNNSVTYAYYTNGFQKTRAWARGITVTNQYNEFGDLVKLDYTDSTPDPTYSSINRFGLPRSLTDGTGTHSIGYDHELRVISDACTSGTFSGITLSNHFHQVYGRDWVKISGISPTIQDDYTYDNYGRLGTASYGLYSAAYGYLVKSDLLQTTTNKNNGVTKLTTTRNWEYGSRLQSIDNTAAATVSRHAYAYDTVNRRTRATLEDSSAWNYDYDDRNEVTLAKRVWADQLPVSGQQFAYAYDNIGNRTNTFAGGDVSGANLRSASYTANALNQYTAVTVPGAVDVVGAATATATVTVNGQSADRKVEYYHRELVVANSSAPVYLTITNSATQGGSTNLTGNLLVAKASNTLAYDLDGNLTGDGLWTYTWDGENRLTVLESDSAVPSGAKRKLEFTYDHEGRRATKKVSIYTNSTWQVTSNVKCVYDGWNLLSELNATNNAPIRSYLWGLDLSGTTTDAGGVGGLLLVADHAVGTYHFVAYDGNGNVMALVNASDQSLSARYEYGPFGELIRSTGPMGKTNPFRFSTKFSDEESSLVYYGYRYYAPILGRWINRDPIEEEGSENLYSALLNSPMNQLDSDGRALLMKQKLSAFFTALAVLYRSADTGKPIAASVRAAEQRAIRELAERIEGASKKTGGKGRGAGGIGGPPKNWYRATGMVWSLLLVSLESSVRSVHAAANVALGIRSEQGSAEYALESSLINYAKGETAYGDLDAIESALLQTGGAAADALMSWDTFAEAGEVFQ